MNMRVNVSNLLVNVVNVIRIGPHTLIIMYTSAIILKFLQWGYSSVARSLRSPTPVAMFTLMFTLRSPHVHPHVHFLGVDLKND